MGPLSTFCVETSFGSMQIASLPPTPKHRKTRLGLPDLRYKAGREAHLILQKFFQDIEEKLRLEYLALDHK